VGGSDHQKPKTKRAAAAPCYAEKECFQASKKSVELITLFVHVCCASSPPLIHRGTQGVADLASCEQNVFLRFSQDTYRREIRAARAPYTLVRSLHIGLSLYLAV
jgi:hypothetical protein